MNEKDIKKLCPKAERILITPDGTIGMKVGEFSQSINVNYSSGHQSIERQVRNLYNDLLAMGREQEVQIAEAMEDGR